jgi:hypothetical protein
MVEINSRNLKKSGISRFSDRKTLFSVVFFLAYLEFRVKATSPTSLQPTLESLFIPKKLDL